MPPRPGRHRVPVLDRRVLDLRVVQGDELHDGRVQLVLVPHGCGTTLQVGDIAPRVGDDQRPFELSVLSALIRKYVESSIGQRTPFGT